MADTEEKAPKARPSLKNLHPVQRSKIQHYATLPKKVLDDQMSAKRRLLDRKKALTSTAEDKTEEEIVDEIKHEKLIGQLKAAESRNRLRIMRLKYEANRTEEINHLIACQSTALKAVRFQALVPPKFHKQDNSDTLDKLQRSHVESLLDDKRGLLTNRII